MEISLQVFGSVFFPFSAKYKTENDEMKLIFAFIHSQVSFFHWLVKFLATKTWRVFGEFLPKTQQVTGELKSQKLAKEKYSRFF